jgi:hypothetical protein
MTNKRDFKKSSDRSKKLVGHLAVAWSILFACACRNDHEGAPKAVAPKDLAACIREPILAADAGGLKACRSLSRGSEALTTGVRFVTWSETSPIHRAELHADGRCNFDLGEIGEPPGTTVPHGWLYLNSVAAEITRILAEENDIAGAFITSNMSGSQLDLHAGIERIHGEFRRGDPKGPNVRVVFGGDMRHKPHAQIRICEGETVGPLSNCSGECLKRCARACTTVLAADWRLKATPDWEDAILVGQSALVLDTLRTMRDFHCDATTDANVAVCALAARTNKSAVAAMCPGQDTVPLSAEALDGAKLVFCDGSAWGKKSDQSFPPAPRH